MEPHEATDRGVVALERIAAALERMCEDGLPGNDHIVVRPYERG